MKKQKQPVDKTRQYTRRQSKRYACSNWSSSVDPGQYMGSTHDMLKAAGLL